MGRITNSGWGYLPERLQSQVVANLGSQIDRQMYAAMSPQGLGMMWASQNTALERVGLTLLSYLRITGGGLQIISGAGLCGTVAGCSLGSVLVLQGVGNVGGGISDYVNIYGYNYNWNVTERLYSAGSVEIFGSDHGSEIFLTVDLVSGGVNLLRPVKAVETFKKLPILPNYTIVPNYRVMPVPILLYDTYQIGIGAANFSRQEEN